MDPVVYQEIIETLARETGKHVDIIINEMARHYGIKEHEITESLKTIDSPFVHDTNRVVGYLEGEPIKRTTYHMQCKRIFEKLCRGFDRAIFNGIDCDSQTKIAFITEAMYEHLKSEARLGL